MRHVVYTSVDKINLPIILLYNLMIKPTFPYK